MNPVATSDAAFRGGACPTPEYTIAYTGNYTTSADANDATGYSGLKDRTDYHWAGVFKAAMISTLLGAGAEFGAGDDRNLVRALRRGSQDSINRAGEQIVSRELNIRPSLTIRPGFPVRVMVTRDLIMDEAR
jgi:type IV secretion system protein VirB10